MVNDILNTNMVLQKELDFQKALMLSYSYLLNIATKKISKKFKINILNVASLIKLKFR
jgi:hypothetical protein